MRVEALNGPPEGWDDYVTLHPLGTAYHRSAAVGIGARAFGLRTTFLVAYHGGKIVGVLPVVEQSSLFFGRFLVSLPFVTYGGILSDDPDVARALVERASEEARARKANHVELRHMQPLAGAQLAERLDKVSMVLALPDSDAALAKQLGSKLRSQIRRAEREEIELTWGGEQCIADFYRVFAPAMHDLGTPVYPRRFFDLVYDALHDCTDVLIVKMRGKVHAAAILVRHGDTIEVPWAVASPEGKRLSLNMRMYRELLRHSIAKGAQAFDFGRSTIDSGTYRFKAQWGAKPRQLHWHYWLPGGARVPKLNQSNPKYARAAALWRRMPLWCANLLGPRIVRNLP